MTSDRRTHRLAAAALVSLVVVLGVGPTARTASAASPVASADAGFTSLLNGLRSTLGLRTLAVDPQLSSIARAWSGHMADRGEISHNGALGSQVTPSWSKLGENVGMGMATLEIFNALVASAPHLRNMSDPDFSMIGIGTVTDARGRLWTTHVFMQPAAARASTAPALAAPAKPAAAPAPTRAPKAATATTAAPRTVAPATTAAPVATAVAPVPTTLAAEPVTVTDPADVPTAVSGTPTALAASSDRAGGVPGLLLGAAVLLALLVMGAAGLLLRGSSRSRGARLPR